MNTINSYNTQITLPDELYQAIAQQAEINGRSVSSEIISLLADSLGVKIDENLADEFLAWETASDKDWLSIEESLAHEAS